MSDTEYLAWRAQQELQAAIAAPDRWVRNVHLQLADAYSLRLNRWRKGQLKVASISTT